MVTEIRTIKSVKNNGFLAGDRLKKGYSPKTMGKFRREVFFGTPCISNSIYSIDIDIKVILIIQYDVSQHQQTLLSRGRL